MRAVSGEVSIERQAAALVMPGFNFGVDDPAQAERLVELGVGGFCLYGGASQEIAEFTRRLQERAPRPLLFSADYEDGAAAHVPDATPLPSNMGLGAAGSETLAFEKGLVTAAEARAIGVRWVFAPVLDLATVADNPIVNVRSFGSDPGLVSRLARAYIKGLSSLRVLSCLKHFPGHGETHKDSHLELPVLRRSRAQLSRRELLPFKHLAPEADSVMLAHLRIPAFGERLPSSLSKKTVGLLRGLGFDKLVVTDALSMRAVSGRMSDAKACKAALAAGVDVLLVPTDAPAAVYAVMELAQGEPRLRGHIAAAYGRLEQARRACGLYEDRGIPSAMERATFAAPEHRAQAEKMAAACLAWVRKPPQPTARSLRYLEPDASGAGEWQGKAFVEELRALGVRVTPYPEGEGPVLVACFLSPRAYTGRIRFSPEELRPAQKALSSVSDSVLVSFGSPFVFDEFKGYNTGLCAFAGSEVSQKVAARALMGMQEAAGRIPVRLKSTMDE